MLHDIPLVRQQSASHPVERKLNLGVRPALGRVLQPVCLQLTLTDRSEILAVDLAAVAVQLVESDDRDR